MNRDIDVRIATRMDEYRPEQGLVERFEGGEVTALIWPCQISGTQKGRGDGKVGTRHSTKKKTQKDRWKVGK